MSNSRVPILNLRAQYESIGADLEKSVLDVLRSGNYVLGENVTRLEKEVAELSGTTHGVGIASGTDALLLSLWAIDIAAGDEVITTPFTFAATTEAIALRQATPVYVDIDPVTFNIDPSKIEQAITERTRAIIPVHLYGLPSDMGPIMEIASRHGLKVIEDNAQAIGATYKGAPTGSFGDTACISFYPTKNLGAIGDAGMIVTGSETIDTRLRSLRAHGSPRRYYHDELGINSRLDEIQAAALVTKLAHLNRWNARRQEIAALYEKLLSGCPGIVTPNAAVTESFTHVWHQYTIRVQTGICEPGLNNPARQALMDGLSARGVGSMCYYPLPLHMQKPFACDYKFGDFPESERAASEVLSLPMYPELEDADVEFVARCVIDVMTEYTTSRTIVSPVVNPVTI